MYDKKGSITRTFFTPNKWKGINTPSKWKGYFSKTPILFKAPYFTINTRKHIISYNIKFYYLTVGPALTKALPAGLPSYLAKFLTNLLARS